VRHAVLIVEHVTLLVAGHQFHEPANLLVKTVTCGGPSKADGKHRLNNGSLYRISRFDKQGNVVLENGWTIARDFGHLAYGYDVTSDASQGKSVQDVFLGQSSLSFPATSREQWYVSVSRGKERLVVYSDDKQALKEAVTQSDERLSATEFINGKAG
jgi:hypothetical protein